MCLQSTVAALYNIGLAFQVPMKCRRDALKNVFMNSGSSREDRGGPFNTSQAARFCAATCR